jgi:alpha-mannosidase
VPCGDEPLVPDGVSQIELESGDVIVSALKPVEEGEGLVLRVLNSTGTRQEARICFGFSFDSVESVRLDETPDGREVERVGSTVCLSVSPHGLRTVRID